MNSKAKSEPTDIRHFEFNVYPVDTPPAVAGSLLVRGLVVFSEGAQRYFAMYVNPEKWVTEPATIVAEAIQRVLKEFDNEQQSKG